MSHEPSQERTDLVARHMTVLAVHGNEGCPTCALASLLYAALAIANAAGCRDELREMVQHLLLKLHEGAKQ